MWFRDHGSRVRVQVFDHFNSICGQSQTVTYMSWLMVSNALVKSDWRRSISLPQSRAPSSNNVNCFSCSSVLLWALKPPCSLLRLLCFSAKLAMD